MAEAYRHIGLTAENIDHFVAQAEVDSDVRVTRAERRQQRHDGHPAMAERGTHAQAPPWHALIGDGFFDLRHIGKDAPGTTQVRLALGGEGDRAGGAQQQARAKALLGTRDDPADRRGRQPQRTCGGRQAALLRHGGEHHHVA